MSAPRLTATLTPHPATPCEALRRLEVQVGWRVGRLSLAYRGAGDIGGLAIPAAARAARTDGLWRRTCFEAFWRRPGAPAYAELNLSPSGQWAAYRFSGPREGMAPLEPLAAPPIAFACSDETFELSAGVASATLAGPLGLALSAVIEEAGGRLSYWALAHPSGRPDFHHPDGFVLQLAEPA